jgi:hypothetical protein
MFNESVRDVKPIPPLPERGFLSDLDGRVSTFGFFCKICVYLCTGIEAYCYSIWFHPA